MRAAPRSPPLAVLVPLVRDWGRYSRTMGRGIAEVRGFSAMPDKNVNRTSTGSCLVVPGWSPGACPVP